MTWQLNLALLVTIPALIVGFVTPVYFLIRRFKRRKIYLNDHIDSKYCRCEVCNG